MFVPIPRIVFCDMEGTLFSKTIRLSPEKSSKTIWTAIAERLGPSALEEEFRTIEKWKKRRYTGYLHWMEDALRIHKKYGLTKEVDVKYFKKVRESFDYFRRERIKTVLLTGGFKQLATKVQMDLGINYAVASCEYFWDTKGKLVGWNLIPCYGYGKALLLKSMMKDLGFKKKESFFIGDSEDDMYAAKAAGLSIAFNGAEKLQSVCTYKINFPLGKENFEQVLKYIFS